jgi:hypothetical protein
MKRGDIFPDDGPEYEKPEGTDWKAADQTWERLRRLEAHEMKTRVIESQVDLLLGIIEAYREGWKQ